MVNFTNNIVLDDITSGSSGGGSGVGGGSGDTTTSKQKFEHVVCSHVVDPRSETKDGAHHTLESIWAQVHTEYRCPVCGADKSKFHLHEYDADRDGNGKAAPPIPMSHRLFTSIY